jgi:hypothetical protein
MIADVERISELANAITPTLLRDYERRCKEGQGMDGYAASAWMSGGAHSDVSRPTENTAVARFPDDDGRRWREDPDPQGEAIANIARSLAEARKALETAERGRQLVAHIGDQRYGRELSGGECIACDRHCSGAETDRLRSGLCDACRHAWSRWKAAGHPHDRAMFAFGRRAQLAGEAAARSQPQHEPAS